MKNLFFLLLISSLSLNLFAQKNKVVSAWNYLKYNELDKAKEAIDAAAEHESSSGMAKTWWYRGKVYFQLATTKEEAFTSLHADPISEAFNSFKKAYSLDVDKIDGNQLNQDYLRCIPVLFDRAVNAYNNKDYAAALVKFEQSLEVNGQFNVLDTLSMYNAGLAAEKAGNIEAAEKHLNKCLEVGYGGASLYSSMAEIFRKQENEEKMMEYIRKGREKFPRDQDLVTTEINFYLKNENYDEALGNLDIAIENDPTNHTLYFARGTIFDQKKESDKAVIDYKKSLEISPEYFDALYNLGALFFNDGAGLFNQANDLPLKEVEKAENFRKQAMGKFNDALPYLEKAHELNPTDVGTMQSLKQLYVRTNQTEKYKAINEKLNN